MQWQDYLEQAEAAFRERRYHDALQLCDQAAMSGDQARYHATMMRGDVLLEMGDPRSIE
ncbi:MAG: hypothetical protein R3C68_08385 [Myxococcota bacterium]